MVITLNSIDWIAFELLNIGNSATQIIEPRYRVLDGLFQAIAVRSGGFYVIGIPSLRIGLQFLYVVMMYISVYPVVITMRHSNVYEERSLGIYADDISPSSSRSGWGIARKIRRSFSGRDLSNIPSSLGKENHNHNHNYSSEETTGTQFIHHQLRSQLSHDLWWLTLATFLITCIEVSNYDQDPVQYSVFNTIFEVVSAYGCVGISVGAKGQDYSYSGGLSSASKVVLVFVMVRGRHRGLPVALDRAVRLPGWEGEGLGGEGGGGVRGNGEKDGGRDGDGDGDGDWGVGEGVDGRVRKRFGVGGEEVDSKVSGDGDGDGAGKGLRKRRLSRGMGVGIEEV